MKTSTRLEENCQYWVDWLHRMVDIQEGKPCDCDYCKEIKDNCECEDNCECDREYYLCENTPSWLMNRALDISFKVNRDKEYQACELCVACGGPGIYIDTDNNSINGYWGGENVRLFYMSEASRLIDDYAEELYNCL